MQMIKIPEEIKQKVRNQIETAASILGIKDIDRLFNIICSPYIKFPYDEDGIFRFIIDLYFGSSNAKDLVYLDLGAGYGLNMLDGLLKGYNVYGIEPSPNSFEGRYAVAVELMKENGVLNPEQRLFNCTGENMFLIQDRFVDVVYSYEVLEHVQNIDKVLLEVDRVLKPKSIAYFTMPNYNSLREAHYEILWIPYILSKSKKLAKIYLRLVGKNPAYVDELNFTTPSNIRKKTENIFGSNNVYILPATVRYAGFLNKYIYKLGLLNFYLKLKLASQNSLTDYIKERIVSILLSIFEPFIVGFRLIIIKGDQMPNLKPSKNHPDRHIVNFSLYDRLDYFLTKFIPYYKGVMVDLGCGEAPYKEFFLQYVDQYIGVDWTNSPLNIRADVISDLNERVALPNECADVVISIAAIEHLHNPKRFLNEAYRILKDGGVIILQVPFQWYVHGEPYDYFRYTPYGLIYLFQKARFREIEIYPTGGFFTIWLLKLNYFLSRTIRSSRFLIKFKLDKILYYLCVPIFVFNQLIAPLLDKLDKNHYIETAGYWVVAKKIKGN
jgi:SAM-dependent methyltransferase